MHPKEPARICLAQLPTPVVELSNLARELGVPTLLMKRDDLTGLEVSGNKIRKLEYLIADARAKGCDTLVTHGGFQSNHCRATAACGARLGMQVRLILRSPEPSPANDGNLFLNRLLGAQITLHPADQYKTRLGELVEVAMEDQRRAGRKPYFFPVGASVPLGCWGYARCVREILDQTDGRPIDLYIPVSSAGTVAGAILGKALFRADHLRVIGVPVSDSLDFFQKEIRDLIDRTVAEFALGLSAHQTPVELLDGCIGEGYAIPFVGAIQALKTLARTQGVLLDPTYTAKAMAGFIDSVRARGSTAVPMFLHTGGVFGLMARRDLFPPA